MNTSTDRIEKRIVLHAPRSRVWRALTNADEFGVWFRVDLTGQAFEAGARVEGRITYPGYEHLVLRTWVERIEPEHRFSYRWHPAAVDPAVDYSQETPTLVVFELAGAEAGTLLTVVESGFDKLPIERRADAFRMNSGGWDEQMKNIAAHVDAR
ncbi:MULTISPECIES: SRPBCC family protein [Burkholderia]|uniref:Vanillate O-demethylase oxidoreductase VanB n=1 Tax=Burkholderia mayonis TaxID=1385591 RepID=A0A1B4FNL1_9BURK|nr:MULTISPECIES: SRPBCC family protein [Burkholderia]AOJ05256.1 vanillate O-demethylase oxidoreductase VanB [Burkholderia mayonis]KVE37002.1 vanillate O-demethylase oxidoreductase VanB [Burkholderia sp. BDU5]KVE40738.1 vanillate O-demethylase oxidoreductase VanB [Burkholderia mayonis]